MTFLATLLTSLKGSFTTFLCQWCQDLNANSKIEFLAFKSDEIFSDSSVIPPFRNVLLISAERFSMLKRTICSTLLVVKIYGFKSMKFRSYQCNLKIFILHTKNHTLKRDRSTITFILLYSLTCCSQSIPAQSCS